MKLFKIICITIGIQFSIIRSSFKFCETKQQGSLCINFLETLQKTFNPDYFIETGTLAGGTTIRAAKTFPFIETIELSERFYRDNLTKFYPYHNIKSHLGNSADVLDTILPKINSKTCIFFLDAHYSGGNTGRANNNTPLINELQIIGKYQPSSIILIDDLRLCQTPEKITAQLQRLYDPTIEGYPTLTQIKDELLRINKNYEFVVYGDIGLIYPKDNYPSLVPSPIIQAMTQSRFFEESTLSIEETKKTILAESMFMHAKGNEKLAIQQLLIPEAGRDYPSLLAAHYKLWNALICLGNKQYRKAMKLLNITYDSGLNHWRIQWYRALAHYHANDFEQAKVLLQSIRSEICEVQLYEALEMLQVLENSN